MAQLLPEDPDFFFDLESLEYQPTLLYRLSPTGIGTADVESLLGYVVRLALAHRVSLTSLVENVVWPEIMVGSESRSPSGLEKHWREQLLGVGQDTDLWIEAIAKLTGGENLERCSLRWLRTCIATKDLLSQVPKYCPVCVEEAVSKGVLDHDSLLMHLNLIRACPKHNVRLRLRICAAPMQRYQRRSRRTNQAGVCWGCGRVGYRCNSEEPTLASELEVAQANELAKLIKFGAAGGIASRSLLAQGLSCLLHEKFGGDIPLFAAHVSVPVRDMRRLLMQPDGVIPLSVLMDISIGTRCSLLSILNGAPKGISLRRGSRKQNKYQPVIYRGSLPPEVANREVRALVAGGKRLWNVVEIERRLGLNRGVLRSICPDLCRELEELHLSAFRENQRLKDAILTRECQQVIETLKTQSLKLTLTTAQTLTRERWYQKDRRSKIFLELCEREESLT